MLRGTADGEWGCAPGGGLQGGVTKVQGGCGAHLLLQTLCRRGAPGAERGHSSPHGRDGGRLSRSMVAHQVPPKQGRRGMR